MVTLLTLLAVGCASTNSCADYTGAVIACAGAAGADTTPYAEESVCGEWTPELENLYGAWYRCQADAYADADADGACETAEGYVAAASIAVECPAP